MGFTSLPAKFHQRSLKAHYGGDGSVSVLLPRVGHQLRKCANKSNPRRRNISRTMNHVFSQERGIDERKANPSFVICHSSQLAGVLSHWGWMGNKWNNAIKGACRWGSAPEPTARARPRNNPQIVQQNEISGTLGSKAKATFRLRATRVRVHHHSGVWMG